MKIVVSIFLIIFFLGCKSSVERYDVVIENITIIDTKNSELLPKKNIYIKNGRIKKVNTVSPNNRLLADTIIQGTGKYILPGFWDMHVHTSWKEDLDGNVFPILLQYGITGIRDMGGDVRTLNNFKERSKKSPFPYPNLFGPGPILDGENPIHPAFSISVTPYNFRKVLDSLRNEQVDFFKVYSLLPSNVMDSIATYSKQYGIDFSGHISEFISPQKASKIGYRSFEHLNRLEELADKPVQLDALFETVREHENWLCPTLIVYQRKHDLIEGQYFYHPLFEKLDKDLKMEWESSKNRNVARSEDEIVNSKDRFRSQKELVKKFYDNQIPLLLGTDFAGMPFIYPGYSYHEEMRLMQEIGIPQFDILKMATFNPATHLGISDEYGTIEKNKVADLVILNKNPVENIENALAIDIVLKSGRIVSK